jgi:hypothetical protein
MTSAPAVTGGGTVGWGGGSVGGAVVGNGALVTVGNDAATVAAIAVAAGTGG